jgi:hypothetical protein
VLLIITRKGGVSLALGSMERSGADRGRLEPLYERGGKPDGRMVAVAALSRKPRQQPRKPL